MYHDWWNKRKVIVTALAANAMLLAVAAPRANAAVTPTDCKRAIAKASADFERAKLKALQGCEDKKRKGKLPATTDCLTETTTSTKITNATAKLASTIASKCATLSLTQIGWDGTGTGGNPVLAKECSAGERQGDACSRELQCPGICVGGAKEGEGCTFTSSCSNRICVNANCSGGSQNGNPCNSDALKTACLTGGGTCNWLEQCDGGSAGALGTCQGGSNPGATCGAQSDCTGGGVCDAGCNTGTLLDCVSGICESALCGTNKDCGFCFGGPNVNQSCSADTDCGKVCSGGSNPGVPCKVAGDCLGGGTCGAVTGSCHTGTCTGGFCAVGSGLGTHARASTGVCSPVDRCPAFENNKLNSVRTCDGGTNNGKFCTNDTGCPGGGTCKSGCGFALTSVSEVAECVTCISEASVDQVNSTIYGELKPAGYSCVKGTNNGLPCTPANAATDCPSGKCVQNDKSLELCKQAVGKAAAKFFDTKKNALAKCTDTVLKAGSGTCPDTNTQTVIDKATTKLSTDIAKACGGKDKAFAGFCTKNPNQACTTDTDCTTAGDKCSVSGSANLDFSADAIGELFNCSNLTVPGASASCAGVSGRGPISTLKELVDCIACVTEFKIDCTTRLANPSAGALFPECNPLCGNGLFDGHCSTTTGTLCSSSLDCPAGETCVPTETCDDSNSATGDTCPGNCNVQPCTSSGNHKFMLVDFTAPAGVELGALAVYVQYPDGTVSIPGSGDISPPNAVVTVPFDASASVNDLDYAMHAALVANAGAMFPGVALIVQLDTCTGAPDPTNDQFTCSVESASDTNGNNVSGVTCGVTVF